MADKDAELGKLVNAKLLDLGIETPMAKGLGQVLQALARENIEAHFGEILRAVGLDLMDDSIRDTPHRMAKLYADEIFWGMDYNNFPKCTAIENKMHYDEMLCVKSISVKSKCEHHLENIEGEAFIAYIPAAKVLGLSKFSRITEFFSRRPQVQERLTQQIGETIKFICETDNVAVYINAKHGCMTFRGVQDINATTSTSYLSGGFKDDAALRKEFYDVVQGTKK